MEFAEQAARVTERHLVGDSLPADVPTGRLRKGRPRAAINGDDQRIGMIRGGFALGIDNVSSFDRTGSRAAITGAEFASALQENKVETAAQ
jgi:hypothetical protein